MFSAQPRELDPLDREILERALQGAFLALKENDVLSHLSDEELEAKLKSRAGSDRTIERYERPRNLA